MKQFLLVALSLPLFLTGCGSRFTDWAAEHVEHGKVRTVPKDRVAHYIRTIRIYKSFSTRGIFDALWLSHDVRQAYGEAYMERNALDKEKKDDFLRRQRVEGDNFISFYILSYIPAFSGNLGDKNCPWTVSLKINGAVYTPKNIEGTELSPEYKLFLHRFVTKQKNVMLVKFAAKDEAGNQLITSKTRMVELQFNTVDRSASMVWYLDKNQNLIKHQE